MGDNTSRNKGENRKNYVRPTAWRKGQSGNPVGRPRKGQTWADLLRRIGFERVPGPGGKRISVREAVVRAAFLHAMNGHAGFFHELVDRDEGLLAQQLELARGKGARRPTLGECLEEAYELVRDDPVKCRKWLDLRARYHDLQSESFAFFGNGIDGEKSMGVLLPERIDEECAQI